jgi:hypothetical protein
MTSSITEPDQKQKEVQLALEVADIIDELNTVSRLFEVQQDTLDSISRQTHIPHFESFSRKMDRYSRVVVEDYRIQVNRLMKDAQRTQQSVSFVSFYDFYL